jgi:hypothetical protein
MTSSPAVQPIQPVYAAAPAAPKASVSWGWWLLPILFSILGGLIGWAALKNRSKGTATGILILGLVLFVLTLIFWFSR